jgi:hypothetical protein
MSRTLRTLGLAAVAVFLAAAAFAATVAFAAGPKKGATYTGALAQGDELVTLKVAPNGKAVSFSAAYPPLYCQGGGGPTRQVTKPAQIANNGSFSGSIAYEFTITHKITSKLLFKGKFVNKKVVTGTARSEFGVGETPQQRKALADCDGSTAFTAVTK